MDTQRSKPSRWDTEARWRPSSASCGRLLGVCFLIYNTNALDQEWPEPKVREGRPCSFALSHGFSDPVLPPMCPPLTPLPAPVQAPAILQACLILTRRVTGWESESVSHFPLEFAIPSKNITEYQNTLSKGPGLVGRT